jgi:hypothetical protein
MRNIDASEVLKNPELEVVETSKGKVLGSSFTLYADEVAPAAVDDASTSAPRKVMANRGSAK